MFDRFRKKKNEFDGASSTEDTFTEFSGKTFQFESKEIESEKASEVLEESRSSPPEQVKIPEPIQQTRMSASSDDIGIKALMDKRTKLEEAIDYVGLMIKNLKEKLIKVGQYIEEEKQGIRTLQQKRGEVEKEADDVATIISNLREKLVNIDQVVNEEGSKIAKFKDSRPKTESSLT